MEPSYHRWTLRGSEYRWRTSIASEGDRSQVAGSDAGDWHRFPSMPSLGAMTPLGDDAARFDSIPAVDAMHSLSPGAWYDNAARCDDGNSMRSRNGLAIFSIQALDITLGTMYSIQCFLKSTFSTQAVQRSELRGKGAEAQ